MNASTPLSELLHSATLVVQAVQAGRSLTQAMPRVPSGQRPAVQAIAFHALRHAGTTGVLVTLMVPKAPSAPVQALLQTALALRLPVPAPGAQYAGHTVVDQAVQTAKQPLFGRAEGLVNAVLRRFDREASDLLAQAQADAVAQWNHPFWWVKRVRKDHPQHWQTVLGAAQTPPDLVLRVNLRRTSREAYLAALMQAGVVAHAVGAQGVRIEGSAVVAQLPGYAEGWFSVQDAAAQLAAPLTVAGLPSGARVLDACAAPGGKTAHLLECADVHVTALEVDAQRAERIHENLSRLGLQAEVRTADAGQSQAWWDGQLFDAVLLDAPCTASGIVRRHPDVRWLRRDTDVAQLVQQQKRLLHALWPLLKPGGRLVYATCSVFKAEGEHQIAAFLRETDGVCALPAPGHLLPGVISDNVGCAHDGFFYAVLQKPA